MLLILSSLTLLYIIAKVVGPHSPPSCRGTIDPDVLLDFAEKSLADANQENAELLAKLAKGALHSSNGDVRNLGGSSPLGPNPKTKHLP